MPRSPLRAALIAAACLCTLAPAAAGAAGGWTPPFQVASGDNLTGATAGYHEAPQLLVDADDRATAVYRREPDPFLDTSDGPIEAATRPAGGAFGAGVPLGTGANFAAALSPTGDALVAVLNATSHIVTFASRARGADAFDTGSVAPLSPPTDMEFVSGSGGPMVTFDDSGRAYLVVLGYDPATSAYKLYLYVRPAGATDFPSTPVEMAMPAGIFVFWLYDLAVDAAGDAVACWGAQDSSFTTYLARCSIEPGSSGSTFTQGAQWVTLDTTTRFIVDVRAALRGGEVVLASSVLDPNGGGRVGYMRSSGGVLPAEGTLLRELLGASDSVGELDVAWPAGGAPVVAWSEHEDSVPASRVVAQEAAAGSSRQTRYTNGGTGVEPQWVRAAPLPSGEILLAFDHGDGTVEAQTLQGAGSATSTRAVGGSSTAVDALSVSADPHGDGLVAFLSRPAVVLAAAPSATDSVIWTSVLDRTPPELTSATIEPSTLDVGAPATFTMTAVDAWSPIATLGWDFGDGQTGDGGSLTHVYSAAGTYQARPRLVDALGNAASIAAAPVTVNAPTTTTPPPPPQEPPPPEPQKTGNATPLSGTIRVKLPGSDRYVLISEITSLPVGTIIDARRGTVELTVSDGMGGTYTGVFSGGIFRFSQVYGFVPRPTRRGAQSSAVAARKRTRRKKVLITDLALRGGRFKSCRRPKRKAAPGRTASIAGVTGESARRRAIRYLKAKAHGRFRVKGRHASGIERGTVWKTTDTCNATVIRVNRGAVLVTDKRRHRTVLVKAHRTYVAKAQPGRRRR